VYFAGAARFFCPKYLLGQIKTDMKAKTKANTKEGAL
jgi:hypothetical protein